ncbi:undecaprenyl-diphosphate phosphatase [Metabacillus sp. RGM 3146]|uniref:undecaprenyl-diphosphate phosphatase n=1 Tax=Metabacillus sp. RGM 3146 TaxID=3401092 RepID=UPI003B9A75B9
MDSIAALILGMIQGLTEFLPISSTGHLYIGKKLFGLQDAGLFLDTMLHIGTFIALIVFYRDILIRLLKNPFGRLTWLLAAGTLPAVCAGVFFSDFFDRLSLTGSTIGWEFLLTGAFLWFAGNMKRGSKTLEDLSFFDSIWIGTFQAFAIFPAVSRSGLTIAGALFRNIDKETAAYFSFLLSIPAVFGAILFQMKDLSDSGASLGLTPMFLATVSAALFGYAAVKWMIDFVKKHSLKWFAGYVWILGIFILVMQGLKVF